jgi:hypothetical protein
LDYTQVYGKCKSMALLGVHSLAMAAAFVCTHVFEEDTQPAAASR